MKNNGPSDKMKQSIRNVFWIYVSLFLAVILQLSYFMIFSSKQIVNTPHNPRLSVLDNEMKRGAIYDNKGYMLVHSDLKDKQYERNYLFGNNLCHILGYMDRGKSGVEARYNFELQKLHNEVWQRITQLVAGEELKANSLVLTINMETQKKAYELLGRKKGAVIVMEPDTGKILAVASYPNYNPNTIDSNWDDLDADESSPFLNRATQGLYTPGSVFKIVTAATVIENSDDLERIYDCEGREEFKDKVINCFDGRKHGEIDIYEAFAYSCNTFFSDAGYRMGAQNLIVSAETRYFNRPLDYVLEYSKSLFQLSPSATESEIVETSIGQGRTMVSPLHMALITSAVANGGIMMRPYVVDHVTSYNGKIVSKNLPVMSDTIFSTEEADLLKEMMLQAVQYGTGAGANIDGAVVAGKTGTAENPNGTSHSWFTAFAEKNGKTIVATVVLENPEDGQTAVPIAKSVLNAALLNNQY